MTAAEKQPVINPLPHPTRPTLLWTGFRYLMRIVFTIWLGYRARGAEKISPTGGGLLLINHQSFLDPLMAGLPFQRPVSYLARDSLFAVFGLGWFLRKVYVMPISRKSAGASSIRESVRRMKHGFLVGIFPEGTRSRDGKVGPMKSGFASLIRRGQVPIYPVGIAGTFEAMPRNAWLMRRRRVRVVYGDPLTIEELERYTQRGREKELVSLVRDRIIDCQQQADQWLNC